MWAPNAITNALRREHSVRSQRRGEDNVTTEAKTEVAQVRECQLPPEVGRGEEQILPKSSRAQIVLLTP